MCAHRRQPLTETPQRARTSKGRHGRAGSEQVAGLSGCEGAATPTPDDAAVGSKGVRAVKLAAGNLNQSVRSERNGPDPSRQRSAQCDGALQGRATEQALAGEATKGRCLHRGREKVARLLQDLQQRDPWARRGEDPARGRKLEGK